MVSVGQFSNLEARSTQTFEGGVQHGTNYTAMDQHEWQNFLAWRQQGSPTAPNHFRSQSAVGGPYLRPQIADQQIRHKGNSGNGPPQSYLNTQPMNPLSSHSHHQATNLPSSHDHSGNTQTTTSVPIHYRSNSQPNLTSTEFLSQQSDVLADDPNNKTFPGQGAIANLGVRLAADQSVSFAHSAPASSLQLPAQIGTTPQVQSSSSSQHGTSQHGAHSVPSQTVPSPFAVNVAKEPQQPQPTSSTPQIIVHQPNSNVVQPQPASQSLQTSGLQSSPLHGRPSSATSCSSYTSDSTDFDEGQRTSSRLGPGAVPATSHADVLPTSNTAPPGPTSNTAGTPQFRPDNQGPLSPQASNLTDGPAPNPSSVPSSHPTPTFSTTDVFAGLKPLPNQPNVPGPHKKKKRNFLKLFKRKDKPGNSN